MRDTWVLVVESYDPIYEEYQCWGLWSGIQDMDAMNVQGSWWARTDWFSWPPLRPLEPGEFIAMEFYPEQGCYRCWRV